MRPKLIFAAPLIIKDPEMKLIRTVLLLVFPLYFVACSTQKPMPNYLQNLSDTTGRDEVKMPELRIQKNDLLSIQVYSASTEPLADAPFNLPVTATVNASAGESGAGSVNGGFLVDSKGNIQYPRLGQIHAEGMTKDSLAAEIRKRLTQPLELLKDPTVIIRFQNLKITVTGEVKSPGLKSIPSERVTILEAIGLAGDVTDYGLKDAVKVVREIDGKRQVGIVDLSSKDVFQSPYYYLMQNDVVVVDPTKKKAKKADQDMVIQRVSFGLSVITAVALVYNILK